MSLLTAAGPTTAGQTVDPKEEVKKLKLKECAKELRSNIVDVASDG